MLRNDVLYQHVALGGGGGYHIGARLYLIGDYRIGAAVELVHAPDLDNVRACASDVGAHGVEEVCKIDYMRLLCGVLNNSQPACPDGGEHDVDRCADGDHVEIHGRACEPLGSRLNNSVILYRHSCAEQLKALDMLVDGPRAEVTAAGHGDLRPAESAEQSADEVIRSPEVLCHIVGNDI